METMKAIVLDIKNGKPFVEMREMPIPEVGSGEVLVKIEAVSICGSDCSIYNYAPAMRERLKKLPHILGHEFAGRIVKLGRGADKNKWHIGDCVSAETHIFCGKCSICRHPDNLKHICPDLKLIGIDRDGCFAEYIAVPERVLWRNPRDLPAWLASVQEPLGNAVYCVSEADVADKNVLLIGDGPAALFGAAVAKIFRADQIVVFGYQDFRLDLAKQAGADIVVNTAGLDNNSISALLRMDFPLGFDVVFEYSGSESGIKQAIEFVRPGGTLMVFGLTKEKEILIPYNEFVYKTIKIKGIYGRKIWKTWEGVSRILRENRDVIESLITHRLSFDEFQNGFDLMMKSRECGKVVLLIEGL